MDTATLIGLLLGIVGVIGGQIMEGGSPASLINIPGLLIVVIGSLGAGISSVSMDVAKRLPKTIGKAFKQQVHDLTKVVPIFVTMADKARREGLLALEEESREIDDPFMRKGLQLMIDGTDPSELREIMEIEIEAMEERHAKNRSLLEAIGGYAPTLGVLGAIMGLIAVLSHLDDTEALGHGIAVAFVASFYGVFTANLIWLPLAGKLKTKTESEAQMRTAMMEGLLAIQAGGQPADREGEAGGVPAAVPAGRE